MSREALLPPRWQPAVPAGQTERTALTAPQIIAPHGAPGITSELSRLAVPKAPLPVLKANFISSKDTIWLYGNVTSTNEPLDEPLIGIYRYQLNANEPNRQKVHIDMDLRGFYGNAAWHPDGYHIVEIDAYNQVYTHHLYDLNTWERIHSKVGDYYSQFNSTAWDWVENKQAALCMSDSAWAIHDFAHFLEMENFTRTKGHPLVFKNGMLRAIAIDTDGAIFGMDYRGNLFSINRHNGNLRLIGNTGLPSPYDTSMYIDPLTHQLYYVCNNQKTEMYIVNTETAQATYLWQFPYKEQIFGLFSYTPLAYDNSPAAPDDFKVDFREDALSGNVTFKVPSKLFSGAQASGNVNYAVKIDRKTVATGTAACGSTVNVPVSVDTIGWHTYVAVLDNATGTSPYAVKEQWTGLDYVNSVRKPDLRYLGNNKIRLTWDACDQAQHGGFMPASEVKYDVIRYPGAIEVAKGISDTKFEETITLESNEPMSCYYAVRSNVRDAGGTYTPSEKIIVGAANPPYSFEADTEAHSLLFTPIDADNDGFTWEWYVNRMICYYNPYNYKDRDDWLISAPVNVKKGESYKVHLDLSGHQSDLEHNISLYGGFEPTVEGMTQEWIPSTNFCSQGSNGKTWDVWITPDRDGVYYLGLHTRSNADSYYLYLNELTISGGGTSTAPAPIEDFTVYTHDEGGSKAYIGFTAPKTTLSGTPLTAIDSITIYRGTTLVSLLENPEPGKKFDLDERLKRTGQYDYTIRAYNAAGSGLPVTIKAYIGNTTPGNVPSARAAFDPEGTFVTWTIPTTSVSGNPINPNHLKFNIYDTSQQLVEGNIEGTETIIPNPTCKQKFVQYLLKAQSPGGISDRYTPTDFVPTGTPFEVPFKESVPDAELESIWKIFSVRGNSSWGLAADGGDINSSDEDGGFLIFQSSQLYAESRLTGGRITIPEGGCEVSLDYFGMEDAENQIVVQLFDGQAWTDVMSIDLWRGKNNGGWNTARHSIPASFAGKTVQIGILGRCLGDRQSYVDNIRIYKKTNGMTVAHDETAGFTVTTERGTIKVEAGDDSTTEVYTMTGYLAAKGNGSCAFRVAPGIYAVRCNNKTVKVNVR